MPIYYQPNKKGDRWQASGPQKYFPSYFVEYRTGGENPKPRVAKEAKKPDAEQSPTEKPAAPE